MPTGVIRVFMTAKLCIILGVINVKVNIMIQYVFTYELLWPIKTTFALLDILAPHLLPPLHEWQTKIQPSPFSSTWHLVCHSIPSRLERSQWHMHSSIHLQSASYLVGGIASWPPFGRYGRGRLSEDKVLVSEPFVSSCYPTA